jgi:putative nucleotidyltransferase with HDIG domain
MRELPPRARWYIGLVVVAAIASSVVSALSFDRDWPDAVALLIFFGLANARLARTADRNVGVTVSFVIAIAAIIVVGPFGACVVGLAAVSSQVPLVKRVFNGAQFAISSLVSGAAYVAAGGQLGADILDVGFARAVATTLIATLVFYLVNMFLVGGIVSLTTGKALRRVWRSSLSWMMVAYCGYGMLGLLLAVLWIDLGVLAPVVLMVPLLVARSAFANYAEHRSAYDSTVRALVQAVETKDYYTRGHSERVAMLAERIAREAGLREDRVQVVRYAGMLHDIGKLGVPTRVLQKQGKLSSPEFEAIKLHPLRGYEMLSEIDFLAEALSGVYHHHERLDGRGYPNGLAGDEIPEFARVIMVADAFDSMTSTRSYRFAKTVEEAVSELRRCEGVQFDPRVVACLVAAVERDGWEPTPETFHGEQVSREGAELVSGKVRRGTGD